jgi:outer membrane biosynthesis protein TonB
MKTPNEPKKYEQEYYRDADGNLHYVERTTESEKPNSYQNGYTHGRAVERSYQNNLSQRDSQNTARGLLIGAILASLATLGGAYAWYRSQPDPQTTESPVVAPEPVKTQPSPVAPEQKTTIIERVKEVPVEKVKEVPVLVPVPQSNTPSTSAPAPNSTSNQSTTTPESTSNQSESTNIVPIPEQDTNSESDTDNN